MRKTDKVAKTVRENAPLGVILRWENFIDSSDYIELQPILFNNVIRYKIKILNNKKVT